MDFDIHRVNNHPHSGLSDARVPGMDSVIATTTGYTGLQKTKLVKLINQTGASYVGSLSKANTHLVCWEFQGRKYDIAKKFGITILNHQWFEDCLQAGTKLPERPYILCSGQQVGPLTWEPPAASETPRNVKIRSSDDNVAIISDCSNPNLIRESLLGSHEHASKGQAFIHSISRLSDEEHYCPPSPRRTKEAEQEMLKPELQTKPVPKDGAVLMAVKSSVNEAVKSKFPCFSTSKQNMYKRPRKTRRLVKKNVSGSILNYLSPLDVNIEETAAIRNDSANDQNIAESSNSDIAANSGCGGPSSNIGIRFICSTPPIENSKNCNEVQRFDSTMDMEMINDVGLPLPLSLPISGPAKEISCAICWTDSSSSRGVLPCGHRFCFVCIRRWANEMVSKKKEPVCPLCMASFDFITVKNHATFNDQRIFSQTLPEFSDENVYLVLGQNDFATQQNLQCNVCRSSDTEELLLRCNNCGKRAAHTFCLDPPLPSAHDVQWSCSFCASRQRPLYELP